MTAPKIIYFHGYGSSPNSDKVKLLKQRFDVIAPSIPIKHDEAFQHLIEFVQPYADPSVVLVGTSLGGYWAGRMSNYFILPAVLINPSCFPADTLTRYQNEHLTEEERLKYRPLEFTSTATRSVLLARDDDVIDYRIAEKVLSDRCNVKLFESGGHRFNDINTISSSIIELQKGFGTP
jgi:hypothetical protein